MEIYNEYEALNEAGNALEAKINQAIKTLLLEHVANGGSIRDFASVAINVVGAITCEEILFRAMLKRKQERKERQ